MGVEEGIPTETIKARRPVHENYGAARRPHVKIVDGLKRETLQRFEAMAGEITGHDSGHDFRAV